MDTELLKSILHSLTGDTNDGFDWLTSTVNDIPSDPGSPYFALGGSTVWNGSMDADTSHIVSADVPMRPQEIPPPIPKADKPKSYVPPGRRKSGDELAMSIANRNTTSPHNNSSPMNHPQGHSYTHVVTTPSGKGNKRHDVASVPQHVNARVTTPYQSPTAAIGEEHAHHAASHINGRLMPAAQPASPQPRPAAAAAVTQVVEYHNPTGDAFNVVALQKHNPTMKTVQHSGHHPQAATHPNGTAQQTHQNAPTEVTVTPVKGPSKRRPIELSPSDTSELSDSAYTAELDSVNTSTDSTGRHVYDGAISPDPKNGTPRVTPNIEQPCGCHSSWRRLRHKKGLSHFICVTCGMKWKSRLEGSLKSEPTSNATTPSASNTPDRSPLNVNGLMYHGFDPSTAIQALNDHLKESSPTN